MKQNKMLVVFSLVAIVALYFIGSYFYKNSAQQEEIKVLNENQEAFVREHSPVFGPETARVTLVEFLDPECEACRAFYPYVKEILKEHEGQVKLVVRFVPFHANSEFAIKIIEAARMQNKFWEALDLLFKYQPDWASHHDPKPELIWNYLPEIGVDIEKIKEDMSAPRIESIIKMDFADAQQLGVEATPTFFVNGKPLPSFGLQQLKDAVEAELYR